MNEHIKGGLLIITSMLLFGFIGPFVRWIDIPNVVFLFYSGLFGFIILAVLVFYKKGIREMWPSKYKWLLILTTIFVAVQVFSYFEAYKRTTFANTVLLHYTAPIFAAVFAPIFLKEKLDKITVPSLILSLLGVYLIFFQTGFSLTSKNSTGIILALISGVAYGTCIVCQKKLVMFFKPLTLMFYQYGGFILWIPFIKANEYLISPKSLMLSVAYIILASLLPTFIYLTGMKYIKGQHIGIISYAEVIAAIVFGWLFFNEIPNLLTLIGGALILLSGYVVIRAEAKGK